MGEFDEAMRGAVERWNNVRRMQGKPPLGGHETEGARPIPRGEPRRDASGRGVSEAIEWIRKRYPITTLHAAVLREVLLRSGCWVASRAEVAARVGRSIETVRDSLVSLEKLGVIRRTPGGGRTPSRISISNGVQLAGGSITPLVGQLGGGSITPLVDDAEPRQWSTKKKVRTSGTKRATGAPVSQIDFSSNTSTDKAAGEARREPTRPGAASPRLGSVKEVEAMLRRYGILPQDARTQARRGHTVTTVSQAIARMRKRWIANPPAYLLSTLESMNPKRDCETEAEIVKPFGIIRGGAAYAAPARRAEAEAARKAKTWVPRPPEPESRAERPLEPPANRPDSGNKEPGIG